MPVTGTKINGHTYSHSSIELDIAGLKTLNISAVNYEATLEPGHHRGQGSLKNLRTRGEADSSGDFEAPLQDAQAIIDALGDGFMEIPFDITVSYSEPDADIITDKLQGCRITSMTQSSSQGSDVLMRTFNIDIMRVVYNGKNIALK